MLIDVASGSTVDWAYDVLQCKFSYTAELPPLQGKISLMKKKFFSQFTYEFLFFFSFKSGLSSEGFVLSPSKAPEVCKETYVGMKALLSAVKKEVQSAFYG